MSAMETLGGSAQHGNTLKASFKWLSDSRSSFPGSLWIRGQEETQPFHYSDGCVYRPYLVLTASLEVMGNDNSDLFNLCRGAKGYTRHPNYMDRSFSFVALRAITQSRQRRREAGCVFTVEVGPAGDSRVALVRLRRRISS
jgi:hypothetical protein